MITKPALDALLAEVASSDRPQDAAMLIIGMMCGQITKATGNSEYIALMRHMVQIADKEKPGYQPVHSIIDEMTAFLRTKYIENMEQTS